MKKILLILLIFTSLGFRSQKANEFFSNIVKKVKGWFGYTHKDVAVYKDDLRRPFERIFINDNFDKVVERVKELIEKEDLENFNKARLEREVEYAELDSEIREKEIVFNLVRVYPIKNKQDVYYYKLDAFPKKSDIVEVIFNVEKNKHGLERVEKVDFVLRSRKIIEVLKDLEKEYGKFSYSQKFVNGREVINWEKFIAQINRPRLRISLTSKDTRLILTYENK